MAVSFLNSNTAVQGTASPTSDAFTINAGSNLIALAFIAYDAQAGMSVSSVTYGGVAMTSCGAASHNTTTHDYCEVWRLVNPPTGSNTLAITIAGTIDDVYRCMAAFSGVDQTTPIRAGSYVNATGSVVTDGAGNYAQAITSAAGDRTVSCVNGGSSNNINTTQTRDGFSAAGARSFAHDHCTTSASSVTHTWSGGGAGTALAFVGFSLAAAPPPVTPTAYLLVPPTQRMA